jgi:galactose mutarotase-like enzyme
VGIIFIENDRLRVGVSANYGARVVHLVDKASGREWMTQGGESPNVSEDVKYLDKEAVAWDECFPTVGVYDATGTVWGRVLRDHGDIWGRPWTVDEATATVASLTRATDEFAFTRRLSLEGATLVADYTLQNRLSQPMPWLWALHVLFAVRAGDTMDVPGLTTVASGFFSHNGKTGHSAAMAWPGPNPELPFRLDEIQPPSSQFMGKLTATGLNGGSARIGQPGQWVTLNWDDSIADLGIWMTYGAWFGHYEVALEPQNAPGDWLGQTIVSGAPPLPPGETKRWRVTMTASA